MSVTTEVDTLERELRRLGPADGLTLNDICGLLGLAYLAHGRYRLWLLRQRLDGTGETIPRPVPDDGWKYRITSEVAAHGHPGIAPGTKVTLLTVAHHCRTARGDLIVGRNSLPATKRRDRRALLSVIDSLGHDARELERLAEEMDDIAESVLK